MGGRSLQVGHGQKRVRRRLEPDEVCTLRRRPGLVELDDVQPPAPELAERDACSEVRALGERNSLPRPEKGEHHCDCGARPRREQESMASLQAAELALRCGARRVRVPLVVELAGLAVAIGPGRRAVDAHRATLLALYRALAGQVDAPAMITFKLALALIAVTGWHSLPPAPITPDFDARTSVWTGKQMIVFGRDEQTATDSRGQTYATGRLNVAATYDPHTKTWRKLSPPTQTSGFMQLDSVWSGREMLVWGQGTRLAYDPAKDTWRRLPSSPLLRVRDGFGAVVWTGTEMLGWGGGCCGDAFSDGVAYNPATNRWRALPKAPLAGDRHPVGIWTGKRYIVVSGRAAAAYDPARSSWQRIAAAPRRPVPPAWSRSRVFLTPHPRHVLSYHLAEEPWQNLPVLPRG